MQFDSDTTSAFGEEVSTSFFDRDPRLVAPDLLGTVLLSVGSSGVAGGRIVETEAYLGTDDAGSHAATKGMTARNAVMYERPGTIYVYFTYGNHHMINLVCGPEGVAGAVLIRALEPLVGVELMERRRKGRSFVELCNGPGKLAQALAVTLIDNGSVLGDGRLHLLSGERPNPSAILTSGRIGLSKGHELPYRYYLRDNRFVSGGRVGSIRSKRGTSK